jgi:lipooligosaccharide transport system ATP-binding protein
LDALRELLVGEAEHVERSADLLLAYTHDSDELMRTVRKSGIPLENTLYRPAGLEDVFLRLTGRSLIE